MRLPPLNALRAFEAAQRHMSFQKAAKELFVTPAALSYQIRQLEEALECSLFVRENRSVKLTTEGAMIAEGVEESFSLLRSSIAKLDQRRSNNVLVVTAGPALSSKWLTPRLYRFLNRYPDIDLRVSASLAKSDLKRDDVDVALRFGGGDYPGCYSIKLMGEYITPMCSPRLLENSKEGEDKLDLSKHPLIYDDTHVGHFDLPSWEDWLKAAGKEDLVDVGHGAHFNTADNALNAAIAGMGIVLGRSVLAEADLDSGLLVAPFDLKLKANFAFYAVVDEDRQTESKILNFINWIQEEIAGKIDSATPLPAV